MRRTLLFALTSIAGGCGSHHRPIAEAPPKATSQATCPPEDPSRSYQGIGEDCEGLSRIFDVGYPFRDTCGCGCATDPVFPPGVDPRSCEVDADCGLSFLRVNTCCGSLCSPGDAYNKASIPTLVAWTEEHCEGSVCPVAGCVDGGPTLTARCEAGRCAVYMHPGDPHGGLPSIDFPAGRAEVPRSASPVLDELAAILNGHDEVKRVRVEGHASRDEEAGALSLRRAEAVRGYLIERGIAADRLGVKGFGHDRPLREPGAPGAAQVNRRVELRILDPAGVSGP